MAQSRSAEGWSSSPDKDGGVLGLVMPMGALESRANAPIGMIPGDTFDPLAHDAESALETKTQAPEDQVRSSVDRT